MSAVKRDQVGEQAHYLAQIFMSLTETNQRDEQAYAEFCAEAEGLLEDWLETYLER